MQALSHHSNLTDTVHLRSVCSSSSAPPVGGERVLPSGWTSFPLPQPWQTPAPVWISPSVALALPWSFVRCPANRSQLSLDTWKVQIQVSVFHHHSLASQPIYLSMKTLQVCNVLSLSTCQFDRAGTSIIYIYEFESPGMSIPLKHWSVECCLRASSGDKSVSWRFWKCWKTHLNSLNIDPTLLIDLFPNQTNPSQKQSWYKVSDNMTHSPASLIRCFRSVLMPSVCFS